MANSQDPFEMDDGFENIPVVQKPVQAVNKVANTVVKQTAQQVKATTKAFISQLYGSSSPSATDDDQQVDAAVDPMSQMQKAQAGQAHSPLPQQVIHQANASGTSGNQTQNLSDEEKIEKARRELQQQHRSEYSLPTFGDITNLESDIRKEAQKREQADQQREQEQEQEEQKMEELKEQKKKEPIAVTRARNKAEMNRGAAG